MRLRARADLIEDVLTAQPQSKDAVNATLRRVAQLRGSK